MAAKKNLNNPKNAGLKVRSTKGPAKYGSGVSRLEDNKKGTVWMDNGKGNSQVGSYSKALGSTKSTAMKDTKKVVKSGAGAAGYDRPTKKGTQLAASKSTRAKKKGK